MANYNMYILYFKTIITKTFTSVFVKDAADRIQCLEGRLSHHDMLEQVLSTTIFFVIDA